MISRLTASSDKMTGQQSSRVVVSVGRAASLALRVPLDAVFNRVYDQLFDTASATDTDSIRESHIASLREIKAVQAGIRDRVCGEIESLFRSIAAGAHVTLLSGAPASARSFDSNTGINRENLRRAIRVAGLNWKAETDLFEEILSLLSTGQGTKAVNPLSPEQIAEIFQRAIESSSIAHRSRSALYDAFTHCLLNHPETIFAEVYGEVLAQDLPEPISRLQPKIAEHQARLSSWLACPGRQAAMRQGQNSGADKQRKLDEDQQIERLTSRLRAGGLLLPLSEIDNDTITTDQNPEENSGESDALPRPETRSTTRRYLIAAFVSLAIAATYYAQRGDLFASATPALKDAIEYGHEKINAAYLALSTAAMRPKTIEPAENKALTRSVKVENKTASVMIEEAAIPVMTVDKEAQESPIAELRPEKPAAVERPEPQLVMKQDKPTADQISSNQETASTVDESRIAELLQRAEVALQELRFTVPAQDSAFENFSAVLLIDPNNATAKAGMQKIIAGYLNLAGSAVAANDAGTAATYLSRARFVQEASMGDIPSLRLVADPNQ